MDNWPVTPTDHTFAGTSSLYSRTIYEAQETHTAAVGDYIEIEGYVYGTDTGECCIGIGDGSNALMLFAQSNGDLNIYRYNGSFVSVAAIGVNASWDYTGIYWLRLNIAIESIASAMVSGDGNWEDVPEGGSYTYTGSNLSGVTLTPFVETNDISKCYLQSRIISL